jgi:hypothetical protein
LENIYADLKGQNHGWSTAHGDGTDQIHQI